VLCSTRAAVHTWRWKLSWKETANSWETGLAGWRLSLERFVRRSVSPVDRLQTGWVQSVQPRPSLPSSLTIVFAPPSQTCNRSSSPQASDSPPRLPLPPSETTATVGEPEAVWRSFRAEQGCRHRRRCVRSPSRSAPAAGRGVEWRNRTPHSPVVGPGCSASTADRYPAFRATAGHLPTDTGSRRQRGPFGSVEQDRRCLENRKLSPLDCTIDSVYLKFKQ